MSNNWNLFGDLGKTVVLVEDSPTQALNLQMVLHPYNVNVIVATDGIRGLEMIRQVMPDAVVLDIELPGMNGLEVCKAIKNTHETQHIPVILLTRHDEHEVVLAGLESGAVEFIPKDIFGTAVLLETLKQMKVITPADEPPAQD